MQRHAHPDGKPAGHGSVPAARWTATADASAAAGSANTARNASPTVLKTRPPAHLDLLTDNAVMAARRLRHGLGIGLPQPDAALDIGE